MNRSSLQKYTVLYKISNENIQMIILTILVILVFFKFRHLVQKRKCVFFRSNLRLGLI